MLRPSASQSPARQAWRQWREGCGDAGSPRLKIARQCSHNAKPAHGNAPTGVRRVSHYRIFQVPLPKPNRGLLGRRGGPIAPSGRCARTANHRKHACTDFSRNGTAVQHILSKLERGGLEARFSHEKAIVIDGPLVCDCWFEYRGLRSRCRGRSEEQERVQAGLASPQSHVSV
jgi:hypothetical protein